MLIKGSNKNYVSTFLNSSPQKLRSKNKEIKDLIDKLRTLMWDINIMMAVKPS